MSGPIRRGPEPGVADHGHTKRGDGGVLSASLFVGAVPLLTAKKVSTNAAITTTAFLTAPAAGSYKINVYVEVTTKTNNGTLTVTLGWTDAVGATTDATILKAVTSTDRFYGSIVIEVASGNVTYAVGLGTFTGAYSIRLVAERLA